ncbi:RnfH family protein [Chitinibacteraceae bacterium HSL-7]
MGITVEVTYARADVQFLEAVKLTDAPTAQAAIEASGVLARFPEIELASSKIGIFGKIAKLDTVLADGDRVEIYRPLKADPKEVRRKRVAEGKTMRKGGCEGEE